MTMHGPKHAIIAAVTAALAMLLPHTSLLPTSHPIVGVRAVAPGTRVDILPYFINTTGYALAGTHSLSNTVSGDDLYKIKWDAEAWEHWTVPFGDPAGYFTLVEDTSDPSHRYAFTSPMFPRTMVVGQQYTSGQLSGGEGNLETSWQASGPCVQNQPQQQFPFHTELVTELANYYGLGGNLGAVSAIDLRYWYLNQTGSAYEYEDNWYAMKPGGPAYGLVKWQLWHYDTTGTEVVDGLSTFTTTTTTPPTAPDLSVAC